MSSASSSTTVKQEDAGVNWGPYLVVSDDWDERGGAKGTVVTALKQSRRNQEVRDEAAGAAQSLLGLTRRIAEQRRKKFI